MVTMELPSLATMSAAEHLSSRELSVVRVLPRNCATSVQDQAREHLRKTLKSRESGESSTIQRLLIDQIREKTLTQRAINKNKKSLTLNDSAFLSKFVNNNSSLVCQKK